MSDYAKDTQLNTAVSPDKPRPIFFFLFFLLYCRYLVINGREFLLVQSGPNWSFFLCVENIRERNSQCTGKLWCKWPGVMLSPRGIHCMSLPLFLLLCYSFLQWAELIFLSVYCTSTYDNLHTQWQSKPHFWLICVSNMIKQIFAHLAMKSISMCGLWILSKSSLLLSLQSNVLMAASFFWEWFAF